MHTQLTKITIITNIVDFVTDGTNEMKRPLLMVNEKIRAYFVYRVISGFQTRFDGTYNESIPPKSEIFHEINSSLQVCKIKHTEMLRENCNH